VLSGSPFPFDVVLTGDRSSYICTVWSYLETNTDFRL